jgi:hypothetical protein
LEDVEERGNFKQRKKENFLKDPKGQEEHIQFFFLVLVLLFCKISTSSLNSPWLLLEKRLFPHPACGLAGELTLSLRGAKAGF